MNSEKGEPKPPPTGNVVYLTAEELLAAQDTQELLASPSAHLNSADSSPPGAVRFLEPAILTPEQLQAERDVQDQLRKPSPWLDNTNQ